MDHSILHLNYKLSNRLVRLSFTSHAVPPLEMNSRMRLRFLEEWQGP